MSHVERGRSPFVDDPLQERRGVLIDGQPDIKACNGCAGLDVGHIALRELEQEDGQFSMGQGTTALRSSTHRTDGRTACLELAAEEIIRFTVETEIVRIVLVRDSLPWRT